MIRTLLILLAIADLANPSLAEAKSSGQAAARVIDALATCAVQQEQSKVMVALAGPRDYKRDTRLMRGLRGKNCVPSGATVSIDPMIYRGALARALVREKFSVEPAQLYAEPIREKDTWSSIMGFADCVVRANPAISYRLVVAEAGSSAEQVAFDALSAQINQCKPWQSMSWQKSSLISFFSEAYYRASRADVVSSN